MRKLHLIALSLCAFCLLAGCQPTPEAEAVTSKSDGALEEAIQSTAEPADEDSTETEEVVGEDAYSYTTEFTSADGNISYDVDITLPAVDTAVPVIQVTPHEITAEQAETIAGVLFDGVELYEYSEEMSKSELESEILSIRQKLSNYDALLEYYGGDTEAADYMVSVYENRLEEYEAAYSSADETVEYQPCQWTFYPESHYRTETGEEDSMYIIARVEADDIPYEFSVCNRNQADYRIHSVFVYTDSAKITTNEVYSIGLEEPSSEDLDSLENQARSMLDEMGFSDWVIDACTVKERSLSNGLTAYPVTITASPVYEGIPVVRQEQIGSLKTEDEYAANYYYETIEFEFCGGQLTFFEYQAPLEVVAVLNDNVEVLSVEEIINAFESQMQLDDITSYQADIPDEFADTASQVSKVKLSVTDVEFGLTRIRIANNESDFYLVPAYTFRGTRSLTYSDGMKEQYSDVTLVVINAVDGSIIDVSKGY